MTTVRPDLRGPCRRLHQRQLRPRSTTVSDGRKSRVVVSEPSSSRSLQVRLAALRSGGTPAAITQVDGALESSPVKK